MMPSKDSNLRHVNHKFNALPTSPPRHEINFLIIRHINEISWREEFLGFGSDDAENIT